MIAFVRELGILASIMSILRMRTKSGLAVLAALILAIAGSAWSAPRLTLAENVFDFGFAPQNATISHKFWLISSGEDTLKILKVVPG